ncbi:hypothetical protein FOCC_FOCC012659 [Frankliniella occidentalis]|nr:hypothetical protein FOCC_FOCC012659 [Frankliniella occidentalis]
MLKKWSALAIVVNSVEGATAIKDGKQWKAAWNGMKSRARAAYRKVVKPIVLSGLPIPPLDEVKMTNVNYRKVLYLIGVPEIDDNGGDVPVVSFSNSDYMSCLQICDAALNIINVDARWRGSVTDNLIWQASPARQVVEQAYWNDRCWLLGDNGYFTAPWLHVPVINAPPGTPEFIYTQVHCRARNVVERCIGVLKSRWRLLCSDRCINYKDAAYAGQMINACCVLHNFCNENRVDPPAPLIENNVDHGAEVEPPPEMPFDVYRLGQQEQQF